tara:strand:- start:586 stop:1086 length:501 start_codon:yes stop_codon:yes gene_type:complete
MKKISIIGPESSGKTTLAHSLSKLLKENFVEEYARYYVNKNKNYTISSLDIIAQKQSQRIEEKKTKVKKFLISDTSIIDILIWSEFKYNQCSQKIIQMTKNELFDCYLLCKPDFPWVKDPLRENPKRRTKIFNLFKYHLNQKKAKYKVIEGNHLNRLLTSLNFIKK